MNFHNTPSLCLHYWRIDMKRVGSCLSLSLTRKPHRSTSQKPLEKCSWVRKFCWFKPQNVGPTPIETHQSSLHKLSPILWWSDLHASELFNSFSTIFFQYSLLKPLQPMDVFIPEEYVRKRRIERRMVNAGKRSEFMPESGRMEKERNPRPTSFVLENEFLVTGGIRENVLFSCFSAWKMIFLLADFLTIVVCYILS